MEPYGNDKNYDLLESENQGFEIGQFVLVFFKN